MYCAVEQVTDDERILFVSLFSMRLFLAFGWASDYLAEDDSDGEGLRISTEETVEAPTRFSMNCSTI